MEKPNLSTTTEVIPSTQELRLVQEYEKTLDTYSKENRIEKEQKINKTFTLLSERLAHKEISDFGRDQKAILRLKLARYFQRADEIDVNTLFDAVIESPRFINDEKGSLHKLFEVHEQKTLQNIAEMRKKRAEIGDKEVFNPWESLFTTVSGNYYMARLLNMPHLEQESEYMGHCVGTSDSYCNRIKRGDIEILSFRTVPKFNSDTQKVKGDEPLITIEYNLHTQTIEQIKKKNDAYIRTEDSLFTDFIDALDKLRHTKTDSGSLRAFKKIAPSELTNIKVKDHHVLTNKGEVHFRDFNPGDTTFVLKAGTMHLTSDITREDRTLLLRVFAGVNLSSDKVASTPEEIDQDTKAYVGTLEPGIFERLPSSIEYIYTSFPEGKIELKTIELGTGLRNGKDFENTLVKNDYKVGNWAKDLLAKPDFEKSISTTETEVNLVILSVADLGFKDGAKRSDIYDKAQELGLELCPAEVGPQLRVQYKDQPAGEYLLIGMEPITDSDGDLGVFYVDHDDAVLWLSALNGKPGGFWRGSRRWVFRRRKS